MPSRRASIFVGLIVSMNQSYDETGRPAQFFLHLTQTTPILGSSPMEPVVKIMDLTDGLGMVPEESGAWLDRQTGRVVIVEDTVLAAVESAEDKAVPAGLADWQEEQLPAARGICEGDKRFLALPDKFDFHEYRHMERFIGTVTDARIADQLWQAIKGKGAFRHFKDTADRLGLREDWFRYRDEAAQQFMLDWAEVNQVKVDKTPGRADPL
jgi:hypothetical protein